MSGYPEEPRWLESALGGDQLPDFDECPTVDELEEFLAARLTAAWGVARDVCECGHSRASHRASNGCLGHGGCALGYCPCEKFTWRCLHQYYELQLAQCATYAAEVFERRSSLLGEFESAALAFEDV